MRLLQLLAVTTCLLLAGIVSAQVSEGGTPVSFNKALPGAVPTVTMAAVNVSALLAEDKVEEAQGMPYRFGAPFDVNYTLDNSGNWQELPDGGRVWRLRISSPGAFSLNLLYSRYRLPEGATLYVYNEDRSMVVGAFTSRNNKDHGEFATQPVAGDVSILEYYEPAAVRGEGRIAVSRVVHAYKDVFSYSAEKGTNDYGESGSCNNNVNCPEGAPWQNEKRAVAMILTSGGSRICTGTMINNVRQDQTPYFLTANHCLGGESTWIFMFKYESPGCPNVNGPTTNTVSGCTRKANYSASDFGLLLLNETPPTSYNITFAGWSNIDTPSQSSTCIHHPSGDIKKISFDTEPVTSTEYLGSTGTTHWRIGSWNDGTTEPGSSGSPLFDQNHRIVGQLHGGYASCTSITSDWYGKLSLSWTGGGSAASRLRDWLDPDNTGTTTLDGFDPFAGVIITATGRADTRDTVNSYEVLCTITSNAALVPSSLLLHYQLASIWYDFLLTPTGGTNEYHGYIPAQSAGSAINYYFTADDVNDKHDTTGTFTFHILYSPSIAVAPAVLTDTLLQGDSSILPVVIQSVGNAPLTYNVSVSPIFSKSGYPRGVPWFPDMAPATREYPADVVSFVEEKGNDDPRDGFATDKSAGGPDAFGYAWVDSDQPGGPIFSWVEISGTGTDVIAGLTDDSFVGPFPIGFSFPFYGNSYTEFYVGSNGIIGFDTTAMKARAKTPLPTASTPNNILAWLWDDLDPTDADNLGGHVYYKLDGGSLVIEFTSYPEYRADPGDVITAEVILHPDGSIIYQYQTIAPGFDLLNCAVGLENATGTIGLQVAYLGAYLKNYLAVKFFMPYQWLALDKSSGVVPPGEADTVYCTFTSAGLDSGTYYANIVVTSNDPDPGDSPDTVLTALTVNQYVCGDANGDGAANIGDAVFIINYVFKEGAAPSPVAAGDANNDGMVNVADCVYLINYVFKSGPAPCAK